MSLMNLQLLGTSHTIHSTACVTHEHTTIRYKSHNPFNWLCHPWTYNRQVQVTQSIQLIVPPMNLQPSGTSHTIHSTDCATHEPTTVRYKSHNPFNWLCHPWTYNHQVQITQLHLTMKYKCMQCNVKNMNKTAHLYLQDAMKGIPNNVTYGYILSKDIWPYLFIHFTKTSCVLSNCCKA